MLTNETLLSNIAVRYKFSLW